MNKKIIIVLTILVLLCSSYFHFSKAKSIPGEIYEGDLLLNYRNATVYAPAVAQTDAGDIGVISTITVTIQNHGSGRVFVDTLPLTDIDMQGSARLAVKVASALVENDKNSNVNPSDYDYFFVVRTSAPVIGGPSAGAVMTVATVALLQNWMMSNKTIMTGMINPDGSIGPIGGITQKIDAAKSVGASRFLLPKGQSTSSIVDYAMNNYIMEVIEVADINEALENFTGYRFTYDESDGQITTDDYLKAMRPLSSSLLDEADALYEDASSLFDATKLEIPNYRDYWGEYYYRDEVRNLLHEAEDYLDESNEWYNQDVYYTSLTISFLSLIDSQFVYYTCQYYDTPEEDRDEYFYDLLNEITIFYNGKKEMSQNAEIEGMISLQGIGAAQERVAEASAFLSYANINYNPDSPLTSLLYLARAKQRSNSVEWWINISSHFSESDKINFTEIDIIALEYIEDAEQSVIYSQVLLGEGWITSEFLAGESGAVALLDSAKNDRADNYPAAALFEALEALVKANLAIETLGIEDKESLIDKTERANKSAASSIIKSRSLGLEPVLAISYYEYASSLANKSDYSSALFYYKYSGMIAGALCFTNVTEDTSSSIYVGIIDSNNGPSLNNNEEKDYIYILLAICTLIAGVGIGLVISGFSSYKKEEQEYKKWKPRSLNDYHETMHYYKQGDMPRSIKDYYKKNK